MIIDFFKNLKTHSQIISLSPHCYSPPNLVPGAWFLWPGTSWLVTPRHPQQMVTRLTMGTQCLQSPGPGRISQICLREVASIQGRGCGLCVEMWPSNWAPGNIGHSPQLFTISQKISPAPDSAKSWETNKPITSDQAEEKGFTTQTRPGSGITRLPVSASASVGN